MNIDSILTGHTLVNGDRLNVSYEKPLFDNYTRNRYCDIVAQNAEKVFPKSKPYLELILKFNNDYRTIFDIHPEYVIGLLYQESGFDPNAVSFAPAIGIAQFMRPTAQDMHMHVYDKNKFKELYDAETNLQSMNKRVNDASSRAYASFKVNNFDMAKTYKLEYDKMFIERGKLLGSVKHMYIEILNELDDDRKKPSVSIDTCERYLSFLCRDAQECFGGKDIHNILRGLAGYNSGFGNVKKGDGLPFIRETIGYVRNIMMWADKISPQQPISQVYDSNPQIISELVASKVYHIDDSKKKK
jgi:hypothetical protein